MLPAVPSGLYMYMWSCAFMQEDCRLQFLEGVVGCGLVLSPHLVQEGCCLKFLEGVVGCGLVFSHHHVQKGCYLRLLLV